MTSVAYRRPRPRDRERDHLRILLVEDSPSDAALVADLIAEDGTETELAHVETLAAALRALGLPRPDCILLDLGLPDSEGLAGLNTLLATDPHIPIVVLTAHPATEMAHEAIHAGAQDYLVKGALTGDAVMRAARYAIERAEAQKARRSAELLIEVAFRSSITGMALLDRDGRFVSANPALAGIFRTTVEDLLGKGFSDFADPDAPGRASEELAIALDGQTAYRSERRYVLADGSEGWLLLAGAPVRHASGPVQSFFVQAIDITEQKLTEERYRRIVETAAEGIWTLDVDGRTTFANSRMAEMLGCSLEELERASIFEFIAPADRAAFEQHLAQRREGAPEVRDFTFQRRDGTAVEVLLATEALVGPHGRFDGALAMVTDITSRRQAEREREQLQGQLDQVQKLETLGQLAGGLAHDFNNLLAVISGSSRSRWPTQTTPRSCATTWRRSPTPRGTAPS